MKNTTKDFQVSVLGIDLAKNSFQLHGGQYSYPMHTSL
jgi:hypothetical protein